MPVRFLAIVCVCPANGGGFAQQLRALRPPPALRISGALILNEEYAVLCIEGPADSVESMFRSVVRIGADFTILLDREESTRTFVGWRLAFDGPSQFLRGHIIKAIEESQQAELDAKLAHTAELIELIRLFTI